MKKLSLSILWAGLLFFSSCFDIEPFEEARPEPCEQPDKRIGIVGEVFAVVRNTTIWVPERPATAEEIKNGLVAMEPLNLWLLVSDDNVVYEACNMPENFKDNNFEVFFDGYLLDSSYNNPRVEGIVPISLIRIE